MDFKTLGLIAPILKAVAAQGYEAPSPIQEKAIPPALAGRDVLGCAQTGTGKTLAFAAPILQRLNASPAKSRYIRALVLTPTRELALQIGESFTDYGRGLPLRSAVIFGGVGQAPQVSRLRQGVDILVATPGRLLDLQGQGFVDLSGLEIFVLDEADRMLDMGFIHDVRRVLKLLPAQKQTLFFSATMPPEVASLVDALLKNPVRVAANPVSSPVETISQWVYPVDRANKTRLLAKLIGGGEVKNALVFTRTKHGANRVSGELEKLGVKAAAIHGNKSQGARQQALSDFKNGSLKVLVATDIAARGLDIEELSHVFNYNLPEVPETYIHRIGRTGRAGRGGTAISFFDFSEKPLLKDIETLLGRGIAVVDDHDWPMKVFEAPANTAGRAVNAEDAEARAAAKERRRARAAENRGETKKAAPPAVPPRPQQERPEEPAVEKKRRRRKKKTSAEGAQAAPASEPGTERESAAPYGDFRRPDPLAGSVVMDATARLLSPKPRQAAAKQGQAAAKPGQATAKPGQTESKPGQTESKPGQTKTKLSAEPAKPSAGKGRRPPAGHSGGRRTKGEHGKAPAQEQAGSRPEVPRSRGGRGRPQPELRRNGQKDSTEQPSLMKPYYLERD